MIGLCKFFDITKGICTQMVVDCLKSEFNLNVTTEALAAAVRRAYLRGLALELRQGYEKDEYTLPAEVWERPNPNIKLPNITSQDFIAELQKRVWAVFLPEMEGLLPVKESLDAK
jgi:aldehyde:ferredoxin oxidoreductase